MADLRSGSAFDALNEEEYINQLYGSNAETENKLIQDNYTDNVGLLNSEQTRTQTQTQENLNRTKVEAQTAKDKYTGPQLTLGAQQQEALLRENAQMKNESSLKQSQNEIEAEIERQRQLLASQYETAIKQAQAENDMEKAQALYNAAKADEEKLIALRQEMFNTLLGYGADANAISILLTGDTYTEETGGPGGYGGYGGEWGGFGEYEDYGDLTGMWEGQEPKKDAGNGDGEGSEPGNEKEGPQGPEWAGEGPGGYGGEWGQGGPPGRGDRQEAETEDASSWAEVLKNEADINGIYDSQLEAAKLGVQSDWEKALSDLLAKQIERQAQTDQNLNKTYAENLQKMKNYAEVQGAYGQGTGTAGAARIAQDTEGQTDLTNLRLGQMDTDAQLGLERLDTNASYGEKMRSAVTDSDRKRAEALLAAAEKEENTLIDAQKLLGEAMAQNGDYSLLAQLLGVPASLFQILSEDSSSGGSSSSSGSSSGGSTIMEQANALAHSGASTSEIVSFLEDQSSGGTLAGGNLTDYLAIYT